ncbi:MAG: hypothetical protein NTX21_03470 [Alphaproteobacteria bacterium]|nr:hypothetical protein [Alphaproteobacteria bacterium]
MKFVKLSAGAAALSLLGLPVAEARTLSAACASASEISAIQAASVQQELTDAALACGPKAVALFNQFQTVFNKELRKSDAIMLKMFKRMNGRRAGDAAYDSFKTRAIAHAEQRRTKPGAHDNFCRTAEVVFAAALAPNKPVLEDFVSGVPVNEANPVDSCEIKVAVALQDVQAGPDIAPTPRPDLPGDANYLPFLGQLPVGPALRR